MHWAVFAVLLIPPLLLALRARRVIAAMRQLRDPEQLRRLLSEDVRAALRAADVDPDSLSLEDIQQSERVGRLVGHDLRRVVRDALLGGWVSPGGAATPAALGTHTSLPSPETLRPPGLPPPIDRPSGSGARAGIALAMVAALGAAVFYLIRA